MQVSYFRKDSPCKRYLYLNLYYSKRRILYLLHTHTYSGTARHIHTDYCEQPNNELSAIINYGYGNGSNIHAQICQA